MAASMWSICDCTSNLLIKAVSTGKVYFPCNGNTKIASLLRACWKCARAHVVSTEVNTSVTSSCHNAQSFRVHAGEGNCGKNRAPVSAHSSQASFSPTSYRRLFPHRHKAISFRPVLQCRFLSGQKVVMQTESKKTQADDTKESSSKVCSQCANEELENKINYSDGLSSGKHEKKENIKTIPNLLTTLRMASAPLLGYLVVSESFGLALTLFTIAGVTDLLDGYIARNFANQTSALGSALDPLADKLLVTILTISMTTVGLIPLPLTGLIVFRDLSLIAGGFYIRYRSLPPPITLSRYFDISHATVNLTPTFISKTVFMSAVGVPDAMDNNMPSQKHHKTTAVDTVGWEIKKLNTGLQLSLVAFSLTAPVLGFVDHVCLKALWCATGATTFLSGTDYMLSWKKYVKLLEKDQKDL